MIFTFWEGEEMPDYLRLCMRSWKKLSHTVICLRYDTVFDFISEFHMDAFSPRNLEKLAEFTLPQQADYIRAHVLRDNPGSYWLDVDTIAINGELPKNDILGNDERRDNTIGFLHSDHGLVGDGCSRGFFIEWCEYQEKMLDRPDLKWDWSVMGNRFTDDYFCKHSEIEIGGITMRWPETYMIDGDITRRDKYGDFYFNRKFKLSDLAKNSDILMLHNSWTPECYKKLSAKEVLSRDCTLSYILKEVL